MEREPGVDRGTRVRKVYRGADAGKRGGAQGVDRGQRTHVPGISRRWNVGTTTAAQAANRTLTRFAVVATSVA